MNNPSSTVMTTKNKHTAGSRSMQRRVRAKSRTSYNRHYIALSIRERLLDALDRMGLALANARHRWTTTERRSYERAIRVLTWP